MIRVGIVGYGNLGKGVENAVRYNDDMQLDAIFTKRNPKTLKTKSKARVLSINDIDRWQDKADVLVICKGSATELPVLTPKFAEKFNVVDSYDTHQKISDHFENVDKAAKKSGKVGVICVGWDPGLFSVARMIGNAVLPNGKDYTFWGKGVSQGHSDAIRKIKGVKDARQYTIPVQEALDAVRNGKNPELTTRQKHTRECFVVLEDGANPEKIEQEIKTMPYYFADYDTTVHFITEEELLKNHSGIPHGGSVFRTGQTSDNTKHVMEYNLNLDSNPEFTSSVLLAYARAAARLNREGQSGCKTVLDVPLGYLSAKSPEELRKTLL